MAGRTYIIHDGYKPVRKRVPSELVRNVAQLLADQHGKTMYVYEEDNEDSLMRVFEPWDRG